MGERGTVTIGVDYYTDLVREHAIMQDQIRRLKNLLRSESDKDFRVVYIAEVANIFGIQVKGDQE